MGAEADVACNAESGQRSTERLNFRNGCRHHDFDTRAGRIDVAVPKLLDSYLPDWLLEPRERAERVSNLGGGDLLPVGVATRCMDKRVQSLGISGLVPLAGVGDGGTSRRAGRRVRRHRHLDHGP